MTAKPIDVLIADAEERVEYLLEQLLEAEDELKELKELEESA